MKLKCITSFLVLMCLSVNIYCLAKPSKDETVVIEMNYCINTLTNIIHNKSMAVLEHESDQLVNNLTMEQIIGLHEIKDFRIDLMDAVGKFEITEEERSLMRRVQSIKRDNMKWAALSNALNPTMLLTGNGGGMGPQLAFQVLLTAARSAVEYKTMQGEQNIEELQAMWELRKEDMQTINDLRKSAQGIVFELYNKYHLKESDRLTESTANLFNEYVSEADAAKRIRILEDNAETYSHIPEYYYHLGMAYLDINLYTKAKSNFIKYLEMYKRTPFLRYDERSGCIALAMLTNEYNLSETEKVRLINIALRNMPNNSAAILQCAMVYIYELKQNEVGFKLLRSGIDNLHATDKEILYMAAANLLPAMKEHKTIYNAISETLRKANDVSYDSFVTYLIHSNNNAWPSIKSLNRFSECYFRTWYSLWFGKSFSRNFHLSLPKSVRFNYNDFKIYTEEHSDDDVTIRQLKATYKYSITEEDINDVKCFKANKNLKYLYVETIEPGVYKLKDNIKIDKIIDESWPRQSEFILSKDDIDDIVEFCEDNINDSNSIELIFNDIKSPKQIVNGHNNMNFEFYGDSLSYKPYHSKRQNGNYVRIIFNNGLQIMYKYGDGTLQPYFYSDGKNKTYWNDEAKLEYSDVKKEKSNKKSNKKSWWSTITSWFSSNGVDSSEKQPENVSEEKKDEPSWFSRQLSSVKGWFSSDKDKNKE